MNLVNVINYGIKAINYYWTKRQEYNLSEDELRVVGVTGDGVMVDETLIPLLQKANEIFKQHGYELIIKDAYRSPELYQLVKQKRYELFGKEHTDQTLNAVRMPHSTGRVVDINLADLKTGNEVKMWDRKDWPQGIVYGFYRDKVDEQSKEFQRLQDLMVKTMFDLGFAFGLKKEFWHFEFDVPFDFLP